jgi:hypothetical protein
MGGICMMVIKITYTVLVRNPQVSRPFRRHDGMDERIIIILILRKEGCKYMD